jgi:phosphate transport system substrate-binding protein
VDIANASRKMKDQEVEAARKNGIEPVEFIVGYDALAVFLHNDNPAESLTFEQLASVYGQGGAVEKWSQLDLEVPGCPSDEIVRVSRQNNSGTYVYFKEAVLGKGNDYKLGSRDMHGSKDVVDLVSKTPCAIGYSGLAYATPEVTMPCIQKDAESPCVHPSSETAINGSYPIARPLFMYTAGQPEGDIKVYLDWILSDEGQCIIQEKGYAPVRSVSCP